MPPVSPPALRRLPTLGRRCLSTLGVPLRSSGVIFDPYVYTPKADQPPLLSAAGLQYRASEAKRNWRSTVSIAMLQKHLKQGWEHKAFARETHSLFRNFMDAHRRGDLKQLRMLVTEGIYQGLSSELQAQPHNETRSAFEVVSYSRPAQVCQIRHGNVNRVGYGQVTTMLQSTRRVVQVDVQGRIVDERGGGGGGGGGGGEKLLEIPTFCVFETCFLDPGATWRLARIDEHGATRDPRSTSAIR